MYEQFVELIAGEALRVIADEAFGDHLQEAVNRDLQRGYDTHERPLWEDGVDVFIGRWQKHHKGNQLLESYAFMVFEHLQQISIEVAEELEQSDAISARTWTKYCDSFLLYNPRFEKQGFTQYLELEFACFDDVDEARIKILSQQATDTAALFVSFQAEYPQLKLKQFTSVQEPVEAEIFGYDDVEENDD